MKKILCIILTVISLASLFSCSRAEKYRDDRKCADVGKELTDSLADGEEYLEFDDNHKKFYFDDTEEYNDSYIIYSSDTNNINEIGVFHAPDEGRAKELEESCREYIEDIRETNRSFISSYAPEELPKLDSAEVRRFGNYVVYTVLPTDKIESAFDKIEDSLKK